MRFVFPYETEPDGDYQVVTFPDIPMAITQFGPGEDAEYLTHDCLIAALRAYIEFGTSIPKPSPVCRRPFTSLDALESAKLALAMTMQKERISNVALAERLGVTETVVRRLLDLDHRSHIGNVEKALAVLGKRLEISVKAA